MRRDNSQERRDFHPARPGQPGRDGRGNHELRGSTCAQTNTKHRLTSRDRRRSHAACTAPQERLLPPPPPHLAGHLLCHCARQLPPLNSARLMASCSTEDARPLRGAGRSDRQTAQRGLRRPASQPRGWRPAALRTGQRLSRRRSWHGAARLVNALAPKRPR